MLRGFGTYIMHIVVKLYSHHTSMYITIPSPLQMLFNLTHDKSGFFPSKHNYFYYHLHNFGLRITI